MAMSHFLAQPVEKSSHAKHSEQLVGGQFSSEEQLWIEFLLAAELLRVIRLLELF
jgi:hypothetical protein